MRITLQHFALFLLLAFTAWVGFFYANHESCIPDRDCGHLILAAIYLGVPGTVAALYLGIAGGAAAISGVAFLFVEGNNYYIDLPNPLATYRATMEEKRALNEAITEKYEAMYNADPERLDRLHKQVEVMEERLEKL